MQAVPTALPLGAGECSRRASISTQRFWISVLLGYSACSTQGTIPMQGRVCAGRPGIGCTEARFTNSKANVILYETHRRYPHSSHPATPGLASQPTHEHRATSTPFIAPVGPITKARHPLLRPFHIMMRSRQSVHPCQASCPPSSPTSGSMQAVQRSTCSMQSMHSALQSQSTHTPAHLRLQISNSMQSRHSTHMVPRNLITH